MLDTTIPRNPTRAHESRRTLLETVADTAGYRLPMPLPDGRRPDVLRVHVDRASLFVGEAKHTEGPYDLASTDRLRHYVSWVAPLWTRGVGNILAVAHPSGLERPWRDRMDWLCQDLAAEHVVGSAPVTGCTTVTFVVFGTTGSRAGPPGRGRTRRSRHTGA